MASSRSRQDAETRRFMGSIYSHRYYRKNLTQARNREERNRQTCERMARLRAQDAIVPPEVLAARLAARREAACKYREKNRRKIAMKAREARARAARERARSREHGHGAGFAV
ncbi:hypothetical protein B0H13DRAFT_1863214 [Mycena leptocephala]|nr:hypothetical protein B0H13DRAFT_1863214 [Mycena leptocephala]